MYSFLFCILLLIAGYIVYGAIIERIFGADSTRATPSSTHYDGVDYVPLPAWKIFLIQFLNIAGLGPVFGAIMGAVYGPVAFLWIVIGSIFGGAVHDYCAGMLSIRNNGESLPETIGRYLGKPFKQFVRIFTIILMLLVGAVFISGPAQLLTNLTSEHLNYIFWVVIIFFYYGLAMLLPIDKLIGRIYPIFGAALFFMAIGVFVALFVHNAPIPEFTQGLGNMHYNTDKYPLFPLMFVSIACGAISGFHATQSPLMARCIKNERFGRHIFYGAMIAEGIMALIWAAAAMSFFGSVGGLQAFLAEHNNNAAVLVDVLVNTWLGKIGGLLAILGVVAAPITTGDTALRSARLIVADIFDIKQHSVKRRLAISIPIFLLVFVLLQVDFSIIWRYFAWSNQTLSVFTLWALTVYFSKQKKIYIITLIPALFMTAVCSTYIFIAPEGFALSHKISYVCGVICTLVALMAFFYLKNKSAKII